MDRHRNDQRRGEVVSEEDLLACLATCAMYDRECQRVDQMLESMLFRLVLPFVDQGTWSRASGEALMTLWESVARGQDVHQAAAAAWATIAMTPEARRIVPVDVCLWQIERHVRNGAADPGWHDWLHCLPLADAQAHLDDVAARQVRNLMVELRSIADSVAEGHETEGNQRLSLGSILGRIALELDCYLRRR